MAYTKGPWTKDKWERLIGADGTVVSEYASGISSSMNKTEEVIANANLRNAAADMYEALKLMIDELNAFVATSGIDLKDPKHKNGTWYVRREAARAAISKAEGKQHDT